MMFEQDLQQRAQAAADERTRRANDRQARSQVAASFINELVQWKAMLLQRTQVARHITINGPAVSRQSYHCQRLEVEWRPDPNRKVLLEVSTDPPFVKWWLTTGRDTLEHGSSDPTAFTIQHLEALILKLADEDRFVQEDPFDPPPSMGS